MANRLFPLHVTSRRRRRWLSVVLLVFSVSGLVIGGEFVAAPPGGVYKSRFGGRCERITVPLCLDMKYNMTRMPNLVGHSNQAEAAMQVHEFVPLIQFGCSRLLKFFLCSMYAPMCTVQVDEPMVIPACRSMCLEVRQKCEPVLERFNFNWPPVLDCSALPERTDRGSLCIDLPPPAPDSVEDAEYQAPPGSVGVGGGAFGPSSRIAQNPEWTKLLNVFREGSTGKPASFGGSGGDVINAVSTHRCPDRFVATVLRPSSSSSRLNDTVDVWADCAARCGVDVMFRAADKDFMSTWLTVWAALSLASSMFAVLTFSIEPSRFDYPERPVIFLAICFVFYSSAVLVRIAAGADTVSCDSPRGGDLQKVSPLPPEIHRYVIREGLESVWCLAVFLLLYFFGTASAVWWSLLAVAWFLASARKWSREAIRSYAGYIHLVGWSLPTVQTIVVLAIRRVDGDELTGLCYVGNQDALAMLVFVLGPLAVYLVVGTVFIVLGFAALFGVRQDLKLADNRQGGHQTINSLNAVTTMTTDVRKLEKLMARIGLFSGLYVAAMCGHLAAICYQQVGIKQTIEKAMMTQCRTSPIDGLSDLGSIQQSCALSESLQSVGTYTLKVTSPLLIGIANGLWMMSAKTLKSWSAFLCRCRSTASSRPRPSSGRTRQQSANAPGRRSATVSNRAQLLRTPSGTRTPAAHIYSHTSSSFPALNKDKVGALSMTTII